MWTIYKYIYYWLYTWNRGLWGESDVPEFNAVLGMSLSFVCNMLSLSVLIDVILGVQVIPDEISKVKLIIPLLSIMAIHYFAFMHKGKYIEIEKEFKAESKKERRRKGILVLLYTFGSMVLYISLLFFGIWLKK